MANVNLKINFVDGEKLFAQQLNNNFSAIMAALNAMNKISWQDNLDMNVRFFKGDTAAIEAKPIEEGLLLYDYELGKAYIDHNDKRVDIVSGSVFDFVVNNLLGNETNKSPSVAAINIKFSEFEETLGTIDGSIEQLATNKLDSSRIRMGTNNPSGGKNGDIYFKY